MLGDIGDGLLRVDERAADVEPTPGRGTLTAQPEGPGNGVERSTKLEGGRRHDDPTIAKYPVPHQHRHAHRCHFRHRASSRVLAHPGDVELALLQDPFGVLEDLVDRRAGALPGTDEIFENAERILEE